MTTRPESLSSISAALIFSTTEGREASGRFSRTFTLRMTWGKFLRSAMSWPSVLPLRWTRSRTRSAVSRPSPVVALAGKRMWPDCSPPSEAPELRISSRTYLSPTGARSMRIPERAKAASRPMLDMVVATTRLPASSPRAWRSRAQASMTASPLTTLPCSSAKRARSASPSKVKPMDAPLTLTWAATISGCRAPQCSLMLRPSGEA